MGWDLQKLILKLILDFKAPLDCYFQSIKQAILTALTTKKALATIQGKIQMSNKVTFEKQHNEKLDILTEFLQNTKSLLNICLI